jgi:transposase
VLFVGDDWAEDHHDVEIVDSSGKRLGRARLPEGMAGMTRLHEMIAEHLDEDAGAAAVDPETGMLAPGLVVVGIETDRGPWVAALLAAGYEVFAINPMSVARYRERHGTSGAKSDPGDAHVLAEIVRLDRDHHRPVAGDSGEVEGLKLVARTHQSLIWDRTRHLQRLRQVLREYYPGLLDALAAGKLQLADPDAWELIQSAPDPDRAVRLSRSKITAILTRNRRRNAAARAEQIQAALRAPTLRQPAAVQAAYATIAGTQIQLLSALAGQIPALEEVLTQGFGQHPDAEIYTSQPGLGVVLGARVLAEFGDDPHRYHDAKARKNYAGTSPITRASGRKTIVLARYARNRRLGDAILLRAHQLTRRPHLLRHPARPRDRPPRSTAPTREPTGRHPARVPQDPHPLRRDHRLGTPSERHSGLTTKTMGCLSCIGLVTTIEGVE